MKKRICALALSVITLLTIAGCNDTSELDAYRKSIEEFYDNVIVINDNINAIDAESDKAPQKLLDELDKLNVLFQDFAALEVPEEYKAVESLADEAAAFMNEAVSLYHSSYSEGSFDDFSSGMAYEKYCRAIVRINYIGDILQGKIPEGENIEIHYENEN
ncbi:MAG: hypothetical protein IJ397_02135 [Lachnospiraceae bacterium]|nr:hypothetical protein [Lachnospiraceae bacterium]